MMLLNFFATGQIDIAGIIPANLYCGYTADNIELILPLRLYPIVIGLHVSFGNLIFCTKIEATHLQLFSWLANITCLSSSTPC